MQDLPTSNAFDDSSDTNARVFLGPDLYLHLDGPSALVSTGPSERVAVERKPELKLPDGSSLFEGKLFYIDWLISDANSTYMAVDLADINPKNSLGAYSIGVR